MSHERSLTRSESIPLPRCPRGWFAVCFSDELAPGQVRRVRLCGEDLVAFRGHDGRAHVVEPHCPHFGAHLGHGGRVVGNAIRCPAHGWEYAGDDGRCLRIPCGDKIPARARLGALAVRERWGAVLAWHHEDRAAPEWVPEERWPVEGRWSSWEDGDFEVRAPHRHIEDNDVDLDHFVYLHGMSDLRPEVRTELEGPFCRQDMIIPVTLANLGIPTASLLTKIGFPERTNIEVTLHRLGLGLSWSQQSFVYGPFRMDCQTQLFMTPTEPDRTTIRYRHRVRRALAGTGAMLRSYAHLWRRTFDEDIPIWENMKYQIRPAASSSDRERLAFRRWTRQFYRERASEPAERELAVVDAQATPAE